MNFGKLCKTMEQWKSFSFLLILTQPFPLLQLKDGVDYADNGDHRTHTTSPSPTATTPSEESYPSSSFHEKMLRDREREKERAEAYKVSQEHARKPKPKRMSMGIMGRIAAFNSGDAFKKKEEEEEAASSASSARQAEPAQSQQVSKADQICQYFFFLPCVFSIMFNKL